MSLTSKERNTLLSQWIKPSSDNEKDQQDRAERMVRQAISAHPAFSGTSIRIYPKGSYANNTNVRRDSDVDIVVQCEACTYWEYAPGVTVNPTPPSLYVGEWTPEKWRREVKAAMVNYFGSDGIDSTGNVAILIKEKPGSRPSADVVPSFNFNRYLTPDRSLFDAGSCVFGRDNKKIVNWPNQQLENGRTKNRETNLRYKYFVRALKNAENALAKSGVIDEKPSYLMECLIWNAKNTTLMNGDLETAFGATLTEIYVGLKEGGGYIEWAEPNDIKYLFRSTQKWTVEDARQIVLETWNMMGYGA